MPDLNAVFTELRSIMAPCAAMLDPKKDDAVERYVDTKHLQKNTKPLFFGAVEVRKSFVGFHLMPVCVRPEHLEGFAGHHLRLVIATTAAPGCAAAPAS